ncbi:MAG: RluA family pseudouridine synthase [Nannocystaceae bacterium]|nr:RluA family pseudouridine synthase [Nannocystaceae bacterium]
MIEAPPGEPAPPTLGLVVVEPEDDGARADVVLGRRVPGLSRRVARQRGLAGALSIDGRRAAPSARVSVGTRIELRLAEVGHEPPPPIVVLAVTDDFVYVDKPPGIHTQRLRHDDPATLADAVAAVHPECATAGPSPSEGGAVHRLDRETSGVVCFARNRDAWERAREAFSSGSVHKTYLAAVAQALPLAAPLVSAGSVRRLGPGGPTLDGITPGCPGPTGLCFDAPLGPQSGAAGTRRVQLSPQGRDAISDVWPVLQPEAADTTALATRETGLAHPCVVLVLRTGHRHQARVHLAAVGCAIVGDPLYGPEGSAPQMLLHAGALHLGPALPQESRVVSVLPSRFSRRA